MTPFFALVVFASSWFPGNARISFTETRRKDRYGEAGAGQSERLLPMAAQLADALKRRGLSSFSLTSYKAEVSQTAAAEDFLTLSGEMISEPAGVRLEVPAAVVNTIPLPGDLASRTGNFYCNSVLASRLLQSKAEWR